MAPSVPSCYKEFMRTKVLDERQEIRMVLLTFWLTLKSEPKNLIVVIIVIVNTAIVSF